jgi:hypothetical protein
VTTKRKEPPRVGAVRPSQLMYAFGVGSTIDLPNFSVVVAGLDSWDDRSQEVFTEPRLLDAVRGQLGAQVAELRSAPWLEETRNAFDEWAWTGVPVVPFPRWLRCPRCRLLAPIDSGLFQLKRYPYRPDLTRYVHQNCTGKGKPPTAVPARFVVACPRGHLDEFPWIEFAHANTPCSGHPSLSAYETGTGARSTDLQVQCGTCDRKRHLSHAFGESALRSMPKCRGRHPHLGRFDESCPERARAMLLGASNSWFPITLSVLSLPVSSDPIEQVVLEHWAVFSEVANRDNLDFAFKFAPQIRGLKDYDRDAIWAAIQARKAGVTTVSAEIDLKGPEWDLLRNPRGHQSRDFRVAPGSVPPRFSGLIDSVGLAERLREVVALTGFTRVDAPDSGVASDEGARPWVALSRSDPTWVPGAEVRGEGVFIELPEDKVEAWLERAAGTPMMEGLRLRHQRWRSRRGLDPSAGWPGERYVLLHTLAHALILALSLEAGYSSASIRERIYAREPGPGGAMAGILLYTAATDSEGTLGGLVRLGQPQHLGRMLEAALERSKLCSSDPICAERMPDEDDESLHNAACHACLFVPETCCEIGNRYLDRAVLVETLAQAGIGYFQR